MKTVLKKIVAVTAAMLMLVSMLNVGLTAFAWEEEPEVVSIEVEPLELIEGYHGYDDEELGLFVYDWWNYMRSTITFDNGDTVESIGYCVDYQDYWYYLDCPGYQEVEWVVGRSYDCVVSYGEVSCTFTTTIVPSPIASIEIEPITLIENNEGYWTTDWICDEETGEWIETPEYFCYSVDYVNVTMTMRDGTVITNRWFEYNGEEYWIGIALEQSYENRWTVGNTYYGTVSVLGCTTTVPVSIVETPVASFTIEPIELIENHGGYWTTDEIYDEETDSWVDTPAYYRYSVDNIDFTMTLKDGTVVTDRWFEYNGGEYWVGISFEQSYENCWTIGNTYYGTVSVLGYETTVPVTIVDSPVVSIVIEPLELLENVDGDWRYDEYWDEETGSWVETDRYFYYETDYVSYTVTMRNGTVIRGTESGFDYDGQWYSFEITSDQDAYQYWTAGNSYSFDVSVMGCKTTVPVTIRSTPVVSVTWDPVVVREGLDSEESWYYDENGEYVYYECYDWNDIDLTITLQDGTVIETMPYWQFEYNGKYYYVSSDDNQGVGEVWMPGNTYTGTLSVLGYEVEVPVTIEETPVALVVLEPIELIENYDGDWQYDEYWDDDLWEWVTTDGYFCYSPNGFVYTVTMKDGAVIRGAGTGMYYNDVWYPFNYRSEQSSDEGMQWTVGNTYSFNVNVMGYRTTVPVTIVETPVASVTIKPITMAEGEGEERYWWDDEQQESVYYNCYDWMPYAEYTVTLKDGTVFSGTGDEGVEIGDRVISFQYSSYQEYESRWLPDNTYCETVTFLGVETEVYITIVGEQYEDDFGYIVKDGQAYIVACNKQPVYLEIPATLGGYPVVSVTKLGNAMRYAQRLVIPDSVTKLSGTLFEGLNLPLQKLTIGSGITTWNSRIFGDTPYLDEVIVSADNPALCSVDGVVYDKALTTMIFYPPARTTTHKVPQTVTDVDAFVTNMRRYNGVSVEFPDGIEGYKQIDGVLYNDDMTSVLAVSANKTGAYEMPDTVTGIAYCAFMNSSLEKVTISENVTDIAYYVFAGSKKLKSVTLPDDLQSVSYGAFSGCAALTDIALPEGLEQISYKAFSASGVTNITIPSTVRYIDSSAFENSDLKTVTISEGVEYIGEYAFARTPLTAVTIPNSVRGLDNAAFQSCTSLSSITFGTGLSSIPYRCFQGCAATAIVFPENIEVIGYHAFTNSKKLKAVDFKNDAIVIDQGAFRGCPIENLELGDKVSRIGENAFQGSALTELTLPDSVTEITYRSFAFSSDLLNIDIGDNVTYIDPYAFEGTAWYDSQPEGAVYLEYVFYDYKGTMDASTDVVIKDGTRLISDGIFYGSGFIDSVHIPASVEKLDENTFSNCWVNELTVDENNPYFCVRDGALYDQNNVMIWRGTNKPVAMEIVENGKTDFVVGQALYSYHMPTVQVTYADGGTEMLTPPAWWASGFDTSSVGEKTVTITLGSLAVSYDITVEENAVRRMYVNGKTTYTLGEALDLTLEVEFVNGSWESIEEFEVIGYDAHTEGVQEITVVYGGARETLAVYVDGSMTYHGDEKTDIMVNAPVGTLDADTTLVVEKGTIADVPQLDNTITENKAVAVFDISLKQNGVEVQPDGKVSVSIPVPATMDPLSCTVYHIADDGTVEDMRAQYKDGCMVFDTDGFSYYVMVADKGAMMGDLNGDGIVNIADATVAFRASNGRIVLTSEQKAVADVNKDGIVNIADATMLFRFANGRLASID